MLPGGSHLLHWLLEKQALVNNGRLFRFPVSCQTPSPDLIREPECGGAKRKAGAWKTALSHDAQREVQASEHGSQGQDCAFSLLTI